MSVLPHIVPKLPIFSNLNKKHFMSNKEANDELKKDPIHQINDLIAEVNNPMMANDGDSERRNLDRIKHILKRMGFQQAAIDYKASQTNKFLLWLTALALIPALETIVKFVKWIISQCQ